MESPVITVLYIGKALVPCAWMLGLYMRRMCTIILLTTSVWPLVWGWKAVDLVSLVSNIDQRLYQNVLRNLFS